MFPIYSGRKCPLVRFRFIHICEAKVEDRKNAVAIAEQLFKIQGLELANFQESGISFALCE